MIWVTLLLYNLLLPPALLVMLPRQWGKMRKRGGYGRRFGERFGCYDAEVLARVGKGMTWWVHAVSVGEMLVALKLIEEVRRSGVWTGTVVLTTTTSTGRALAEERADPQTVVVWAPLDLPWVAGRALRLLRPERMVLVEAEIWPNLVFRAVRGGLPVQMANARLSPRSEKRFRFFRPLVAPVFRLLDLLCAQDAEDARRFQALGVRADRIAITGSVKFDEAGPQGGPPRLDKVRAVVAGLPFLSGKKIVLAASTHPGEEAMVASAWLAVRKEFPEAVLVAVPRHFERAGEAARDLQGLGLSPVLRSAAEAGGSSPGDCLVVDVTGELRAWYEVAAVVVVGKSFPPHTGGQNPAEPVRAGKPTLTGPRMDNFGALMASLMASGGIRRLDSSDGLVAGLRAFLADPAAGRAMAERGKTALDNHRGATARTVEALSGTGSGVRD